MQNSKRKLVIKIIILFLLSVILYYQFIDWAIQKLIRDANSRNLILLQKRITEYPIIAKPLIIALKPRWWYLGKDSRPHEAMYALKKIGEPVVRPLIPVLKDEEIRNYASYILARTKGPTTLELLIKALNDRNPYVRAGAATALGTQEKMGHLDLYDSKLGINLLRRGIKVQVYLEAVDPLIVALNDSVPMVRKSAAASLGELGDLRAIEPIASLLNDEDFKVQANVIEALTRLKYNFSIEFLRSAILHKDPAIRESVLLALGKKKDAEAIKILIDKLKESTIDLNVEGALISIGEPAVASLSLALNDENSMFRDSIVRILRYIGGPSVIEPLIVALNDENSAIRRSAANALREITKQKFSDDYNTWHKWREEQKVK